MRAAGRIVAIAAVTLCATGCAGPPVAPPPPPPPSVSVTGSDCEVVLTELTLLASDLTSLVGDLATDPVGAMLRIGGIVDRFESLSESVSDPELQAQLEAITGALEQVLEDAQVALSSEDPLAAVDEVTTGLTEVQSSIDDLVAYCGEQG